MSTVLGGFAAAGMLSVVNGELLLVGPAPLAAGAHPFCRWNGNGSGEE